MNLFLCIRIVNYFISTTLNDVQRRCQMFNIGQRSSTVYVYVYVIVFVNVLFSFKKRNKNIFINLSSLSVSKKIALDPICVKICRRVDQNDFAELFNTCWLQVRECEIRNPDFTVDDHRKYFKTVVRNTFARGRQKIERQRPHVAFESENSGFQWCEADLIAWCEQKVDDEDDQFYREILTLHHRCRFNTDAIELTGMSDVKFYEHLKEAKTRFKNDLIASRNTDDTIGDDLV